MKTITIERCRDLWNNGADVSDFLACYVWMLRLIEAEQGIEPETAKRLQPVSDDQLTMFAGFE